MSRRRIRRRRAAVAVALAAVAAAIGLHTTLDEGSSKADGLDAGDLGVAQLAGERLVAGFAAQQPPAALQRMIHQGRIAGVVLFSGNFGSPGDARGLTRRLESIRRPPGLRDPLLILVDQEGGLVKRLSGAPFASAAEMGRRGGSFSRRQGALTAANLERAGMNVDLAPVLDVGRAGSSIRAEQRSFGATAEKVSATAIPFAAALQHGGVAATGKHFPGLGAATGNTDVSVERISLPAATIRSVDERPFRDFAQAGGKLVMLSSAIYPAFSERPAVFTRQLATTELRDRIGFQGVSISDDLQSAAAQSFGDAARTARAAAAAGTDLLLYRSYKAASRAETALRTALRLGALPRDEFVQSAQRVLDLRAGLRPNH